jgi:hypothetical protein
MDTARPHVAEIVHRNISHLNTFWSLLICFVQEHMFLNVLIISALSIPRGGLICNPYTLVQSKHSLQFSCFP